MTDSRTLQRFRAIVESGTPLAQGTVLHLIERANQANTLEAANTAREQAQHQRTPAWAGNLAKQRRTQK